jgi:hypothetical protein
MPLNVLERVQPQAAAIAEAIMQVRGEIRVSSPATVVSFDEVTQTIVAQIAIGERIRLADGVLLNVTFKEIADVPIQIPTGGPWTLTFPIQQGDECDLLFADGCIDSWFQSGGTQARMDGRRHSIADAVALFGLHSQPRKLANYSTTSCQLRHDDGQTMIDLAPGVITVKAATVDVQATTANVVATGTAKVQGATVQVEGSTTVEISGSGSTVIEGKDWLSHIHSNGTVPITGTTGPPV